MRLPAAGCTLRSIHESTKEGKQASVDATAAELRLVEYRGLLSLLACLAAGGCLCTYDAGGRAWAARRFHSPWGALGPRSIDRRRFFDRLRRCWMGLDAPLAVDRFTFGRLSEQAPGRRVDDAAAAGHPSVWAMGPPLLSFARRQIRTTPSFWSSAGSNRPHSSPTIDRGRMYFALLDRIGALGPSDLSADLISCEVKQQHILNNERAWRRALCATTQQPSTRTRRGQWPARGAVKKRFGSQWHPNTFQNNSSVRRARRAPGAQPCAHPYPPPVVHAYSKNST